MKKIIIFLIAIMVLTNSAIAQNDKGKGKGKDKAKNEKSADKDANKKHEDVIWDGTRGTDGSGPKPSKNQPAKVRAAFQRDYPNATNVTWSKYRGDWTASFNGGIFRSTAVYHANGERRDTRTPVPQSQLPQIIFKDIFKGNPTTQLGDVIKIEVPRGIKDIFRVKTTTDGNSRYLFYNSDGVVVQYDY